jgi:hypothetical protein
LSVIEGATVDQKQNENTAKKRAQLFGATQSDPQTEAEELLPQPAETTAAETADRGGAALPDAER